MESAIPRHLICPRSVAARQRSGHVPPYPSFSARLDEEVERVVMANFGIQWRDSTNAGLGISLAAKLAEQLDATSGVANFDLAQYVDEAGYETLVLMTYWLRPGAYEAWRQRPNVLAMLDGVEHLGTFREVLMPDVRRLETLYSSVDAIEGVGQAAKQCSGEVIEHAYWGSSRDRLPIAQVDALSPVGELEFLPHQSNQERIIVRGHENIAMIRSGQNWSTATGQERDLFINDIEPTLRSGMNFLRDSGQNIGCYFNRYMQLVDLDGSKLERSFGWSFWRSLADLEAWAERHPSHLAIFGAFNRVVVELNFQLNTRYSHDIFVVRAQEQFYEYVNCHPETGFLKAR